MYKQAWIEHCKTLASIRAAAIFLSAQCLCSSCGLIMVGEPVEEQDLTLENDAEENLKAIRSILADQPARRSEAIPSGHLSQPSSSDAAPSGVELSLGARPVPSPSSSAAAQAEVPAKLPWAPNAPDRPAVPDRPVPAYTIPAPVGPDHSGSIRCAPDGMGGQRCVGR